MAFNLKTQVWQTGSLDWWGMIDGDDVYLGNREFPLPPDEGDRWQAIQTGDIFQVIDGVIRKIGHEEPKVPEWL